VLREYLIDGLAAGDTLSGMLLRVLASEKDGA
jgi:hypothetical protein